MVIRSRKNQYRGVNAHYQSVAQHEFNGWRPFHSTHITDLMRYIQTRLPAGYEVEPEDSLQLHDVRRYSVPDALIWNTDPDRERQQQMLKSKAASPTLTREIEEILSDEDALPALIIKELRESGEVIPVTRIEVLSPANKGREGREIYFMLRKRAIQSDISVVEVDYLHETDTPIPTIPGYASFQKDAHPYLITAADVRPHIRKFFGYGFDVDEPLFPIELPLTGEESITVDFGEVYTYTLENVIAFINRVNYAKEPVNFHTYTQADQQRIYAVMLAVIDAERAGKDLSQERFPALTDDPALKILRSQPYQQAGLLVDEPTLDIYWLIHTQNHELLLLKRTIEDGQVKTALSQMHAGTEQEITAAYTDLKTKFEQTGSFT